VHDKLGTGVGKIPWKGKSKWEELEIDTKATREKITRVKIV